MIFPTPFAHTYFVLRRVVGCLSLCQSARSGKCHYISRSSSLAAWHMCLLLETFLRRRRVVAAAFFEDTNYRYYSVEKSINVF